MTARGHLVIPLLVVALAGVADAVTGDDVSVTSLYLLPVAWAAWHTGASRALLVAASSAVAYLLGDFVFTEAPPENPSFAPALNTVGNLLIYSGIVAAVSRVRRSHDERARLLAELQEAHAQVRTLQGLLPICAWCKRIRDEDQKEWRTVEAYVASHTGASFTHGICPDCAARVTAEASPSS